MLWKQGRFPDCDLGGSRLGCAGDWGRVWCPWSWLSRRKGRGRPELSPVLPPSVSTGQSCRLHLAWLMTKPGPVQDWSWRALRAPCGQIRFLRGASLGAKGLGRTGALWAVARPRTSLGSQDPDLLPSQTVRRLQVPLQSQLHAVLLLDCKYGLRGPERSRGQPRVTRPSPRRVGLGTQLSSLRTKCCVPYRGGGRGRGLSGAGA